MVPVKAKLAAHRREADKSLSGIFGVSGCSWRPAAFHRVIIKGNNLPVLLENIKSTSLNHSAEIEKADGWQKIV